MFKFLKITCQEANEICNKSQYNEATLLEKVKLNIHIIFCKFCAKYSKQNAKLTNIFKSKAIDCKKNVHRMKEEDKELLKEKLREMTS
ncbi:hypothetical protein BTO06_14720 [Tenacibaculum sp. SZ-18]|uniref:hypothetical protein n=1 Tax=Tenacibaculum sp. SZ-18 TaxID=754423 RepID=UPI000C2D196E|nr:hypothetical protein [Tenacibaculum sp. SZ-18]AUC16324.1 hypothetical protein BTO06_14720 [Tenacibaculum sp. SZ-18]